MFNSFKIKTLIGLALGFLITMLLVIGVLGIYSADHTATILRDTSLKDVRVGASVEKIRFKMEINRSQILQALQHNPGMEWSKLHDHPVTAHFKIINDTTSEIRQLWRDYTATISSPEERTLADAWYAQSGSLGTNAIADASAAVQQEKWDDAESVLIKTINPTYRASDENLRALTEFLSKRAKTNSDAVNTNINWTGYVMAGALLLAALLSIITGFGLVRAITQPLQQAIGIASRVAKGDLGGEIPPHADNEIGQLIKALSDMDASLARIVHDVRVATDTIGGASGQIAAGNLDLSNRTEQQANSLGRTASSMEQLTGTVRQNSDNARQANQLAQSAAEVAGKGGAVVSEVVQTMGSINGSAKKISDIISVIDGIAFQTNILALNAAVEAARAGEQGRGFAVVASEVRNLAQRSAAAAKEIKTLIDDSVHKVALGSQLVDQAGATMEEIVTSVQRVTDIMSEITSASQEQSDGIDHINEAISQMDSATQQNAALVEQAAAAAQSLDEQAKNLAQLVSVFKLGSDRHIRTAPPVNINTLRHAGTDALPRRSSVTPIASKVRRVSAG
jgi:methyl-accepting chemotaxis protein/methyl-accepting chemotaxis protein-1 (serine sensor receptor)